jgi:putative hemolysin
MENIPQVIDIRKAIRNSSSGLLKSLPGFVISLIEKLIWQDEMNAVIYRHRDKSGIPFLTDVLEEWKIEIRTRGESNIPSSGRFIFVANHPVGAIDALAFLKVISVHFPDIISPSNELLELITNLQPVLFGINVFGRNTRETTEKLNQLFGSDAQVMIFPAGEVSRRSKGVISDLVWQKSFISKAIQYKRDIIPVHISGRNSGFFYFVANLRKSLGIKMYIETLLLPREMMKQRNTSFTISFGTVIPWNTFTKERTHYEWAQKVRETVYEIAHESL